MPRTKQTLSEELNTISDNNTLTIRGKQYTIKVMPLEYVREYLEEPHPLITSDRGGMKSVWLNFAKVPFTSGDGIEEIDMEPVAERWIGRLLEYDQKPCTLAMLKEHHWDVEDFDVFLRKALMVSG